MIGVDACLRGKVACQILKHLIPDQHVVKHMPHRILAFGLGIEVTHGSVRNHGVGMVKNFTGTCFKKRWVSLDPPNGASWPMINPATLIALIG